MQTIVPLVSTLIAKGDKEYLRKVYSRAVKYNFLIASFIAVSLCFFSSEILSFFGKGYSQHSSSMYILSLGFILSAITAVNFSVITGSGRTDLALYIGILGSVVQISASYLLLNLGVNGIALGKISFLVASFLIGTMFTFRLHKLIPTREVFYIFILTAISMILVYYNSMLFKVPPLIFKFVVLISYAFLVFKLKIINSQDVDFIKRKMIRI
jgi:O-antigen/teichoic acid export membrane protein